MSPWILGKVATTEPKQLSRGLKSIFLQMHKSSGQLDQCLVEIVQRTSPAIQPKFFENIMRFIELLAIEAFEETEVVRIKPPPFQAIDHLGNLSALVGDHYEKARSASGL